jgi:hypothetical protein
MGVYLGAIYEDVVDELNNGENERLSARFPRAVNRALSQLENKADTGTDFAYYDSKEDTVAELDAKHEYVLYTGVMYWLMRMGERPGDPRIATAVLNDTERQWRASIGDYTKDKLNDDQTTGGLDIANLGYVG